MDDNKQFGSKARQYILLGITCLVSVLFTLRLAQLQLVQGGKYRLKAEAQGIKQITREPIRGAIYDRYGKALVVNIPSFSVTVVPNRATPQGMILLARILRTDTATLYAHLRQYKTNDYSPVRLWRDLDFRSLAQMEELHADLPGVDVLDECKRVYMPGIRASHLLGYTGEVSREQLDALAQQSNYYGLGDIIGKSGVEEKWEQQLRGEKGYEYVAVNIRGQRVSAFNDGKDDRNPYNGFDLYLGVDGELQQYAEELLKGKRGAVVAIDPANGEVLAMASAPDYDPNIFSGVVQRQAYNKLFSDPDKPLLNRATFGIYPPGSTWKPLMAIAGLSEKKITPSSVISCPGSFTLGNNTWKCHGAHGALTVRRAIGVSCNVFFYKLALQLGLDKYWQYGHMFHMGERSAEDISEGATRLPNQEYFDKHYGKDKWPKGALVNLGIGQGELGVSPLQLANYCATIANGGVWHAPHAVRATRNIRFGQGYMAVQVDSTDLHIAPEIIKVVREGMLDCVNGPGGTASAARVPGITVAGKTGTAQAGKGKRDHAWFICFAPFDKPRIALCVLVENSGFGGANSAPIAKRLIEFYLNRTRTGDSTGMAPVDIMNVGLGADANESDALPPDGGQ